MLKRNLPVALLDMINNETWAGKGCMVLGSMVTKPSAAEVAENYVFLKTNGYVLTEEGVHNTWENNNC